MRVVGLKVLKDKLSEYVRIAAAGEAVLISDRDRAVAEIVAPDATRSRSVSDVQLAESMRNGLLSPPLARTRKPPRGKPLAPLATIVAGLNAARENR